jgi:hypothetical protein
MGASAPTFSSYSEGKGGSPASALPTTRAVPGTNLHTPGRDFGEALFETLDKSGLVSA